MLKFKPIHLEYDSLFQVETVETPPTPFLLLICFCYNRCDWYLKIDMQLHKDSEYIVESIEENFGIRWEETILLKSQSFQKLSQPNPTTFFQWWYYCPGHIGSAAKNSPSFVFFTCAWLLIAHYQSDWSAKIRAKKPIVAGFFPLQLQLLCAGFSKSLAGNDG